MRIIYKLIFGLIMFSSMLVNAAPTEISNEYYRVNQDGTVDIDIQHSCDNGRNISCQLAISS